MAIKRILVPIDFSSDAMHALQYGREFAQRFGSELLVLHVVEPIYYATPADMYVTSPNLSMLLEEQRTLATKQLGQLSANLKAKGQRHRTLLKTGTPAEIISDTAKSAKADLIIMSTHGRTGLAHILLGSTTEKVVRHAPCPVLTIRRVDAKAGKKAKRATKSRR
jgi:nucleotide-binding universal stress UspA family protein